MNHKFTFKVFNKQETEFDWIRFGQVKNSLSDGDYELILRKKPTWDVAQMRKYFHGPVRDFIIAELRKKPLIVTKAKLKSDLKTLFGPKVEETLLDGTVIEVNKSTADYSFEEYKAFLKRINDWSMEVLEENLPLAEDVE